MGCAMKKTLMIGIAGNSHSILIAPYILSAYLHQDNALQECLQTEIKHYAIPRNNFTSSFCDENEFYKKIACETIVPDIVHAQPDIITFSAYVWNRAIINFILQELNAVHLGDWNPAIILGGPEIEKEEIELGYYDSLAADYLIWGEGEIPLLMLMRYLTGQKEDLEIIPRLAHLQRGSGIYEINTAEGGYIDLKAAPSAYLTNMLPDSMWTMPVLVAGVETQRGCNFRCAYCMYHKNYKGISYRRVETVIGELKYLHSKGVRIIRVLDANFFSDIDYAIKIFEGINKEQMDFKIFIEVIPIKITDEVGKVLKLFKDASPDNELQVGIGLQSINLESLKSIHRSIPLQAYERAYDLLLEAGAIIKTDIILGLPYETQDTYLDCLSFIIDKSQKGRNNFFALALLRILPGSDLVGITEKEHLVLDQSDGEHYVWATPSMPHVDLIKCLSYNAAVSRIFHSAELKGEGSAAKEMLYEKYHMVREQLHLSNQTMIHILTEKLNGKIGVDIQTQPNKWYLPFRYDYPNALNPYNVITNDDILGMIDEIRMN